MSSWFRGLSIVSLLMLGASAMVWRTTRGADDPRIEEAAHRKAFADSVRQTYSFPFAKGNISLPGNAAVEGNDFLEPSAFPL